MAQVNDSLPLDLQNESSYTSCRHGQQLVQEIVLRTNEMFTALKTASQNNDAKQKLKAISDDLSEKFKKLHLIYNHIQEQATNHQMIDIDHLVLLPPNNGNRERPDSVVKRRLIELIQVRSRQMKEVIDKLRWIVCEANLMMAMRKPQVQVAQ